MEKEVNTGLVICSGQAISKLLNDLERSLFLSFFQSTNPTLLSKCTHFRSYTATLSKTLLLLPTGRCAPVQTLPKATRKMGSTHPITAETAGLNAPDLSSRTFTTWGTFFRVDSVKEVLTALRNRKKQRKKKRCKNKLHIKHFISFNMAWIIPRRSSQDSSTYIVYLAWNIWNLRLH